MNKKLLYILGAAALTSCAEDMVNETATDYLNGSEKTPIEVSLLLDKSSGSVTRAVDNQFGNGDQLIAYLRHVKWDGNSGERTSVTADQAPRLVTFTTTGSEAWNGTDITPIGTGVALGMSSTNTQQATGLTAQYTSTTGGTTSAIYWDDFSNSSSADTDLRTSGHYLQSYYGYCYNGSPAYGQDDTHITANLIEETGVLGWKVAADQSSGFTTSDLLWSYEQKPVPYAHVDVEGKKNHGTLILPYTHAMSKVTVVVKCDKGFDTDKDNFASSSVILKNMNTVATVTAPSGSVTAVPGTNNANVKDITTQPIADTSSPYITRSFSALIVPTVMKDGQQLAEIKGVDGNDYKINLTHAILQTAADDDADWASKLKDYNFENGGTTMPGVHYMITVTIKKQEISVSATIKDWDKVTAEGTGIINFANDITGKGEIDDTLKTKGFDVYLKGTEVGAVYGAKRSTVTWNSSANEWSYDPIMYWPSGADSFYFRALSGAASDNPETANNESLAMKNGQDVLWATTKEHAAPKDEDAGFKYKEGDPIAPRTGDVPLVFKHAMSKISVQLVTTTGNDAVDLDGARISIANIYDQGTIDLAEGSIGNLSESDPETPVPVKNFLDMNATAGEGDKLLKEYAVIPQKLKYLKDGETLREGAVSFYNKNELTDIGGTSYVTTTLEPVPYTAEEIKYQNADLPEAISTYTEKIPEIRYDTKEKVAEHNAKLEGAVQAGADLNYTEDEFKNLLNTEIPEDLFNYLFKNYYGFDYQEYISTAPAFKPFGENTGEDFLTISVTDEYKNCKHNEVSANAYNAKLPGAVVLDQIIPAVKYTEEEVLEHNSKLPGALQLTDIKGYEYKDGAKVANPGDLKTNGEKPVIKMLILLADGSTYTLELATCKATDADGNVTEDLVTEWEQGAHYTYTVILTKQQVTFRAMVKDWVEKKGSGNATLEWD